MNAVAAKKVALPVLGGGTACGVVVAVANSPQAAVVAHELTCAIVGLGALISIVSVVALVLFFSSKYRGAWGRNRFELEPAKDGKDQNTGR